jgi:hypothetical protein
MGDVKYRFVEYHKKYSKLIVRSADIVVIRVGRHTGAVFWNPGDMQGKVISDHFVLVRGAYITKRELFQDLIRSRIRGLTTRYITKGDLEICLSMVNAVSVADGPSVLH